MINESKFLLLFRAQYSTVTGIPVLSSNPTLNRWKLVNQAFTPPPKAMWGRESLMPVHQRTLSNHYWEYLGILQLDLVVPELSGTEAVDNLAELLLQKLRPCQALNGSGATAGVGVVIENAEPGSPLVPGDGWFYKPCFIRFRAYNSFA